VTKGKGKKESRAYFLSFSRRLNERRGPAVGAVRVWFSESDIPTSYEFYNRDGFLESVTNNRGHVIHSALAEGAAVKFNPTTESWISAARERFSPVKIIRMGLAEAGLQTRHGGDTGIAMKGDQYKGKEGPEYSMPSMNDPGDRGQDGSAQAPGDYDDASEEGDGDYVQKGTWPTSGKPVSMPGGKSESYSHTYVAQLNDKISFLEGELARYEDTVQEQHETISGLREATRQSELERARAEAYESHPELRRVERNLLRCESVEELQEEICGILSLVETVQPTPAPAPDLVVSVAGMSSRTPRNGVPSGVLNESSSPFSDRLGTEVRLGIGDVASRMAAHRKRRRK